MAYLDTFFKIKQLPISKEHAPLYCEESCPIRLRAVKTDFDITSNYLSNFIMRDGAFRVAFEILEVKPPDNWFGVYFRAGASPFMGSHLVYVRRNGNIEIAVYPGPRVIEVFPTGSEITGIQTLTVQFENDYLELQLGNVRHQTYRLRHQIAGRILPAAWKADVNVHSVEMICRDTIEWM